jgi:hypothetical protein
MDVDELSQWRKLARALRDARQPVSASMSFIDTYRALMAHLNDVERALGSLDTPRLVSVTLEKITANPEGPDRA